MQNRILIDNGSAILCNTVNRVIIASIVIMTASKKTLRIFVPGLGTIV